MFSWSIHSVKAITRAPVQGALLAAALAASPAALADAVTDWNAYADTINLGPPPVRARATAIMHVAIHDALNSIDPKYGSYAKVPRARKGASPDAAVGESARAALGGAAPALAAAIDAFHATWSLSLPGCPSTACADGVSAGAAAANAILLLRTGDGSSTPHLPFTLPAGPGVYQPTPVTSGATPPTALDPVPPQFAGWARVTPFVLKSGSQFRAEPSLLFNLRSWVYTRDFLEVKSVGRFDAETLGNRTADQSEIARFWPAGGANMNAVARIIIGGRNLDLWQHARLFALINMANSDAAVTVFDTKYTYTFWRPVTAIRAGGTDGNPFTAPDGAWLSYQNTPPYPDYTCGLTNAVGSGLAVLRSFFDTDRIAYTFTTPVSAAFPSSMTRSFRSLSQAGFEAVDARVFGGMHFRTGCVRGLMQGGEVGRYVFERSLRPHGKKEGHDK